MDWRKIEQALIEIARGNGWDLDEDSKSGDKFAFIDLEVPGISLTDVAKELAERLA